VTLGAKYLWLDARRGVLLGQLDLGSESVAAPALGPRGTVAITTTGELLFFDPGRKASSRIALPGKAAGAAVLTSAAELVLVTVDGKVWLGAPPKLRLLASLGAKAHFGPTLMSGSDILVVTEGESPNATLLHRLSLANGKERWRVPLRAGTREPSVDSRGDVWLMDDGGVVRVSATGRRRWTLDLRGNETSLPPLIGSDGTVYLSTFRRLTALSF
jgi:outer membrane protein assembly factor BamB